MKPQFEEMKKLPINLVLICLSASLYAQKAPVEGSPQEAHYIDVMTTSRVTHIIGQRDFATERDLTEQLNHFFDRSELALIPAHTRHSPVGDHYSYERWWKGKRIYRGQIKCNLQKSGRMISWYHIPLQFDERLHSSPYLPMPSSVQDQQAQESEDIWFPSADGGLIAARRLYFADPSRHLQVELITDPTEEHVLYAQDLVSYAQVQNPVDTTIEVMVFEPDPLTTANQVYGGLFQDQNDADIGALNNQRVNRTTKAYYDNGSFYMENEYVLLEDFELPASTPPVQSVPKFDFTRGQQDFEYTNVLYHLTTYKEYMLFLGFSSLMDYQIVADPHAFMGQDNSYYSPGQGLGFGEGGVDDAEDADVIVHEYGHAISDDASPATNVGTERRTLDEANGDYLAASYSHSLNPFNWQDVYSWDGHNVFWDGREVVTSKNYKNVNFSWSIYEHTDLWAGCLMDIYFQSGRGVADRVLLQALYSQAQNMSFNDLALEVLAADSMMYWGQHAMDMYTIFENRGILDIPDIGVDQEQSTQVVVYNSSGFANGESLTVHFDSRGIKTYALSDMQGRVVRKGQFSMTEWSLSGAGLSTGIYTLSIRCSEGESNVFRLIRY